jgi:biopolymer transport protein ExbD
MKAGFQYRIIYNIICIRIKIHFLCDEAGKGVFYSQPINYCMAAIQQSSGSDHAGRKVHRRRSSTNIDMTPMVDLAFLLLTFFILTSSLHEPFVLKVAMPPDSEEQPPELPAHKVLTLVLGEEDKIYWYQGIIDPTVALTSFSRDDIRKMLLVKNAEVPGIWVLIKPSSKSRYQNIIDILDEITITTITNYAIVKITPADEKMIELAKR